MDATSLEIERMGKSEKSTASFRVGFKADHSGPNYIQIP